MKIENKKDKYLVDSLSGLLPKGFDAEKAKAEYFQEKYRIRLCGSADNDGLAKQSRTDKKEVARKKRTF